MPAHPAPCLPHAHPAVSPLAPLMGQGWPEHPVPCGTRSATCTGWGVQGRPARGELSLAPGELGTTPASYSFGTLCCGLGASLGEVCDRPSPPACPGTPSQPCHLPWPLPQPHWMPVPLTGCLGGCAVALGPVPWWQQWVFSVAFPPRQGAGQGEGEVRAQPLEALCPAQPVRAGRAGGHAAPPPPLPTGTAQPPPVPLQPAAGDGPHPVRALPALCPTACLTPRCPSLGTPMAPESQQCSLLLPELRQPSRWHLPCPARSLPLTLQLSQ